MAKKTKETTEQVQIDVKKTDEYQKLLSEFEKVKKELAAERSRANIIDEAVQVASSTGELRYRGHYIPAIHYRNISHALGMVTAVRVMEVLDRLDKLPVQVALAVKDAIDEQIASIARRVTAEIFEAINQKAEINAEGTD